MGKKVLKESWEGSKRVTGTELQTAWAPWFRDFTEMLETHLAEVKHKGQPKFGTLNPKLVEDFSMPWFTKRTASLPSPCPTGPGSSCATPLGSPPLGPCQDPAPHGPAGSPLCQTTTPQAKPPICKTTGSLLRRPPPLRPARPQLYRLAR
jgi:hypothetical protein